ncbi:MAG TPA: carboxypeptidase regulatory-like domain-containing protein [Gemmatimonadaceae bacterium]
MSVYTCRRAQRLHRTPPRVVSLAGLGVLAMASAIASALDAQIVRGTTRERVSGAPVAGVLVTLEPADSTTTPLGSVIDRSALTNTLGEFALRAPGPGTYRLAAKRIGVQRHRSDVFRLTVGETRRIDLVLESAAHSLEQVVVTKAALCVTYENEARRVAALWDDITAALTAAEISVRDSLVVGTVTRYARLLEPARLTVLREAEVEARGLIHRPFASPPADSLAAHGYWRIMPADTLAFYGPDTEVLASDAFRRDHCFAVARARRDRPGLTGLTFEPAAGRRGADIRGTIWVDAQSSALRLVEFQYTGLARVPHIEHVGGEVYFDRLPNGGWIVRRWFIRMPRFGYLSWREGRATRWSAQGFQLPRVDQLLEEGGAVRGEELRAAALASLAGAVRDSAGLPFAGARVRLVGTAHVVVADSQGTFAFAPLAAGRYTLAVEDAGYARYGVAAAEQEITVADSGATTVDLAAADTEGLATRMCGGRAVPAGRGALRVVVVDSLTAQPVAGAEVRLTWSEYETSTAGGLAMRRVRPLVLNGTTDGAGAVTFCGVPPGTGLEFGFAAGEAGLRRVATLRFAGRVAALTVRTIGR